MNLAPGARIETGPRSAYEVAGQAWDDGRNAWLRARKRFWNYRESDRSLHEAGPEEALDVLIRVPHESDGVYLELELERVFALPGLPWLPEPIDRLDNPPALVLSDPRGTRLSEARADLSLARLLRLGHEWLEFDASLREHGLAVGFEPGEVVIGSEGRWTFLGTDRIGDGAGDLAAWAAFFVRLAERNDPAGRPDAEVDRDRRAILAAGARVNRDGGLDQAPPRRRWSWRGR